MSGRLSEVEGRVHSVRQLSAVISAMRGIAAARSREARGRLDGIAAYAQAVGAAIGRVIPDEPASAAPAGSGAGRHAVIAFCAEQGFAGAFSDRVLAAAREIVTSATTARLTIIGSRGASIAREHGLEIAWSAPMIAHASLAAGLANRVVEALYRSVAADHVTRATVVYARPQAAAPASIVSRKLIPFDFARFPRPRTSSPPILTMPRADLLEKLVREYVFAELCEAVTLSFAAENEARMRAMTAARENVAKTLDTLVARSRQLRQEEITGEIVELASAFAPRPPAKPPRLNGGTPGGVG